MVYKTPNAGMTDQGLAGTADLQTVRPLAFGKRALAFNIRGEKNSEKAAIGGMKNTGNRYTVTYIDQFDDKKVGLALGYAHTESPYQTLKKESWGFGSCGGNCSTADAGKSIVQGEKDAVDSSFFKRDGYMGVLEFKPNDQLHMTFDAYHSDFDELQRIARIEYPLACCNTLTSYTTSGDTINHGVIQQGLGSKAVVENYINQRKDKLDAIGWNTEYKLNDQWSLMADLSDSKVDRQDNLIESTAGTGPGGAGTGDKVTFDQTPMGLVNLQGIVDYSDFSQIFLTDPNGWGGTNPNTGAGRAGYAKTPHITDEIKSIKLAATRTFGGGFLGDVVVGYDHTDHTKAKDGIEGELYLKGTSADKTAIVPTQFRTGVTDAQFLGSNTGMISYDTLALWQSGFFDFTQEVCQGCIAKTWSVNEKLDTFYVRGDVNSTLFGKTLTGNIGLQAVHADQKAASLYTDGTATGVAPQSGGTSYTDYLPSINLNMQLADDTTLRLGIGTTIARPRMDDMAAGTSFGVTNDQSQPSTIMINGRPEYWSGGGGNPNLKPWKANNFDLSLEKYFGRKGYVSAAFFYKDLNRYIYSQSVLHDFTGAPLPTSSCTAPSTCVNANQYRLGYITAQANGSGGHIQGVELTASVPGELMTPWLDGFGVIVSGAFNQSSVNPGGLGKIDLPGLSKEVINTTLYYEKYGFSARISNRYRGDFLGEVPDYTNSLQNQYVHSESIYDAQLSYSFQDGPMKGLTLSLSGSNLNNEPFYIYNAGHKEQILRYEKYGSTYLFGLNYRY